MHKFKRLFATFLITSATWFHAQAQSTLGEGLSAHYRFDGNASDSSGNGNNGVARNTTPGANRFGRTNGCFQFNNSWVFVPFNSSLFPSNQTISMWFKNAGAYQDTALIRSGNAQDDYGRGYGIYTSEFSSIFGFNDFSGSLVTFAAHVGAPVAQWPLSSWAQLVAIRDGNTASLYLNGVLIDSETNLPPFLPAQSSPLFIGSGEVLGKAGTNTLPSDVPGGFWHGSIDDVRIYNRPLSPAEVHELYKVEAGAESYLSGAWYQTKTTPTNSLEAGEIRIWLYHDGTCRAEREFNNNIFDLCRGAWSQKTNATGHVTSTKMTFVSDHAGETFIATAKNNAFTGIFTGGGYGGKFQVRFLPATQDPNK